MRAGSGNRRVSTRSQRWCERVDGALSYRGLVSSWGNIHGVPGGLLDAGGARKYGAAAASRGAFIEQAVARALESWLSGRPDRSGLHLFHDLSGFRDITGAGLGPVSLGTANMDHVILSGQRWILADAKGLGAGTLTTDARGRGVLIQPDGTQLPQQWMDVRAGRSAAGVLVRLTGLRGWPVWVLPDATTLDLDRLPAARAFRAGGTITQISEIYAGGLDELLPVPQPPAEPAAVAALARYVADVSAPAHTRKGEPA
jgi:hypothetical protein